MSHVVRTRLPNGLTVLCEPLHSAPVVALQTWVGVGAADEAPHEAGLAHLHEHMLFKGTARRQVGELARAIEAAGGEMNAWTSFDQTVYHVILAAADAGVGLDVLSDALRHSAFDPGELQRESEVVVEEILRAKDSPPRRLSNALFALVYAEHPYRLPVLGTEASVRSFTREGILAFYRRHYRPDNVTVVAVGDFAPDAMLAEIKRYFGDWQADPTTPRQPRRSEPPQQQLRLQVLSEDVKEARLAVAWHGPSIADKTLAAVDLLATILGHGESSLLFDALRRRAGVVNDVGAYAYTPQDRGLFMLTASLGADAVPRALQMLLEQCFALCHRPVRAADLRKAQTLILSEGAYARETVQGQARKLGFFEVSAGDYAFEQRYTDAIKATTAADIQQAARQLLHAHPAVVLQLPQSAAAPSQQDVRAIVERAMAQAKPQARARPTRGPLEVERLELDSGAIILVRPENSPVIDLRAVALGGQRYETARTCGLGNLFSCVWGTASSQYGPQELAQRVAEVAGSISGFCGRNSEGLSGEFVAEQAEAALPLFCEVLTEPRLLPEQLERERHVVLERIKSREDSPVMVAFDLFARALHPTHPYGLRQSGTEESVAALDLAALAAHQQTFVHPSKLVVCAVGGLDGPRTLDMLAEALSASGGLPMPPAPAVDPPPQAPQRLTHALQRQQAHVLIGTLGARLGDEDRYGLEVLSTILSGQSGRLFLDLRDKQSLAYAISSSNVEGLDPGHFMVHIGTGPDKVQQACDGVYAHLARLCREPVSAAELQRAQRYLIGTHAIELQRGGARAMLMALNERYGLGYAAHSHYAEHISAVSAEGLLQLAQTYLRRERLIEVVVGPQTSP